MFVTLKAQDKRPPIQVTLMRLRKSLGQLPGAQAFLMPAQELRLGGRPGKALYQFSLLGSDFAELTQWTPRVEERLRKLPQVTDVIADQQARGLMTSVVVDRDAAARLGVSMADIDAVLYDAFGQSLAGVSYAEVNQYRVVLDADPRVWASPEGLRHVYLPGNDGKQIPLATIAKVEDKLTPLSVFHQGQFPSATISFNLAPGVSLSQAADAISQAVAGLGLPASIRTTFAGTAQAFGDSLKNQPLLILAALVAVYIVLGVLYESAIHPITILSTLPSAGLGGVAALMAFKLDLSIIAVIGIVLLIGIVKKNGIMMVDFALEAERSRNLGPREAITEACRMRFRPIMMTTLAALLGALPLAFGHGAGFELRRPLGIVIAGGLVVSQIMTLFTTPVIYLYLDRLRWRFGGKRERAHAGLGAVPGENAR
jgi:multidrug efflux pump